MGTGYVDDFSEQKKKKSFDIGARDGKIENSELSIPVIHK